MRAVAGRILAGMFLLRAVAAPAEPAGTLTLEGCLAAAEGQSERLGSLLAEVQARAAAGERISALVRPRLSARASHTRQERTEPGSGSRGFSDPEKTETWLALEQPVFSGFRDLHTARQAGFLTGAAEMDREHALLELRLAVARAYAEVLSAERRAAAVASALTLAENRRAELAARQEAGLARRTETLLAEAQVARHQAQRTRIAGEEADARALLAFLTGRPATGALADFPAVALPPTDPAQLAAGAVARRKDLAALHQGERAAREAIEAQEGGWWPVVGASGNLYGRREGVNADAEWDAMLSAEWPLYEGGRTSAAIREARARHAQAVLAVREKRRAIAREAEESVSAFRTARATRESFEREVAAAGETERLLSEEFRQGIATHIERLTAQDTLLAARMNLAAQVLAERMTALEAWAVTGEFPLAPTDRSRESGARSQETEEKKETDK